MLQCSSKDGAGTALRGRRCSSPGPDGQIESRTRERTGYKCQSRLTSGESTLAQPSVDDFERMILPKPSSAFPGYRAGSIVVRITVWFLPLGRT